MTNRKNVPDDRRFWAVVYAEMFGQISEQEPQSAAIYSFLEVSQKDAQGWFDDLVGWNSVQSEESPVNIHLPLANGVELSVEFQSGDVGWHLCAPGQAMVRLGSIGGHWELPGLRWKEAAAIAAAVTEENWRVLLLLLPMVWLTEDDDVQAIKRHVVSAWRESKLSSSSSATNLADHWIRAVQGGKEYRWRKSPEGWVCTAHWSTRGETRSPTDIKHINRAIAAAARPGAK
ncbi:MAG TPA: hypothetical protein VFE47_29060 [Tepidisphaeraceae bacterium]|jgi:hypothetical protein|nr:hypothetical protein [Tepidisphaeraceae bacterium]